MWDKIEKHFRKYPSQMRVAQVLFQRGLCVRSGVMNCGGVRISDTAVAEAAQTDRRTVLATLETIKRTEELRDIFSALEPVCSFKNVANQMGWGVLEILPDNVSRPGILADITKMIAESGISIRQVIADDPEMSESPKAFIITERPVPLRLLPKIKEVKGVKGVVIL